MNIGVIGTGVMGKSIALLFAKNNNRVYLYASNKKSKIRVLKEINEILQRRLINNKITEQENNNILSNIVIDDDLNICKDCDIIIESTFENIDFKIQIFNKLDKICHRDIIFASNTSSLSITDMSIQTSRPNNFVGIHFFNPVENMKLVEVINTSFTSKNTSEKIINLIKSIKKEVVVVKDSPGFIVNRLIIPMINEAISVYYEGIATKEDIDKAMKFGTNHPMGPLELADFIGLDICLAIMNSIYNEFKDSKYLPHPYLNKMVSNNLLGRKTKKGFYEY